jgi:hypothetical protein
VLLQDSQVKRTQFNNLKEGEQDQATDKEGEVKKGKKKKHKRTRTFAAS